MPYTQFNTSTITPALTASTLEFVVGSTTNITAGDILVIRNEMVKVQEIPVSGTVRVLRGYDGTEARAHAAGQTFHIIADLHDTKINTKGQLAAVDASGVYPDFLFPGQEADDGFGKRYVLVNLTTTCFKGAVLKISNDGLYTAAVAAAGGQGRVGVLTEMGTSNQCVWLQTRGYNSYVQESDGTSAATSAYHPVVETTVSTPGVGLLAVTGSTVESYVIHGMWIQGVASTATTATSTAGEDERTGTGVPVFMHDPYILNYTENIPTSPSSG